MVGLGCGARSYTSTLHYSSEYAVGSTGVRQIIADYMARSNETFDYADYGFVLDEEEQRRRYLIQSLLQADGAAGEEAVGGDDLQRRVVGVDGGLGAVVGTCDAAAAVVDRGAAALDAAGFAPGFCGAPPRGGNTLRVSGRFSTATAKSISTAS